MVEDGWMDVRLVVTVEVWPLGHSQLTASVDIFQLYASFVFCVYKLHACLYVSFFVYINVDNRHLKFVFCKYKIMDAGTWYGVPLLL